MNTATATDAASGRPLHGWRLKAYTIIFEADTVAGRVRAIDGYQLTDRNLQRNSA